MANTAEKTLGNLPKRRRRVPLGTQRTKLNVPEDPRFKYHWFIDEPGRVESAVIAAYDFCSATEFPEYGVDEVLPGNSDLGTKISRVVGSHEDGRPMRAYLMRIPMEYYQEDEQERMQAIDKIEESIRHGNIGTNVDNRYVKQVSLTS